MEQNRSLKVSIAMATYNGEKYILEQLRSILAQTRKPDEVIIYDDGSSDGTAAIIGDFIRDNKLTNWHLSINSKNIGYIDNFYLSIARTIGDIIFLCDQDDVWNANKIEKMLEIFEQNSNCKVLNTSFVKIDQKGQPIETTRRLNRSNNNIISKRLKKREICQFRFEYLIWRNISPGCTLAFNKEVKSFFLSNFTGLSPHDWEINLFGAVLGGLFYYNEALMRYRIHSNNTIGLADMKLMDRIKVSDQRTELVEIECKKADLYINSSWIDKLDDVQKKVMHKYNHIAHTRCCAIKQARVILWLKLLLNTRDYIRLRGVQGILNDLLAILRKN